MYALWIVSYLVATVTAEYVDVIQEFRDTGKEAFPEYVAITFKIISGHVNIKAFKNLHVPSQLPVFIASSTLTPWIDNREPREAAYLSLLPKAELVVRRSVDTEPNRPFTFRGVFEFGGELYSINPASADSSDMAVAGNSLRVGAQHVVERLDPADLPSLPYDLVLMSPLDPRQPGQPNREVPPFRSQRSKRDARVNKYFNNIEILVVVDYSAFQKWYLESKKLQSTDRMSDTIRNIKAYFTEVMNGADMRFMAINDSQVVIATKLVGIFIATTDTAAPWRKSTDQVGVQAAEVVLKYFRDWLTSISTVLVPFDFGILYTSDDIINQYGSQVQGAGFANSICTENSAAVVRLYDKLSSTQATTHLAAHAMGAGHDGENQCDDESYIMSRRMLYPLSQITPASMLIFSKCSAAEMKQFLLNIPDSESCLMMEGRNQSNVANDILPVNDLPGQRWTPDEQCQLLYGRDSYYCGGRSRDSEICSKMECFIPTRGVCYAYPDQSGADGTTCGNKKICLRRTCVKSLASSFAQDECIYGDFKGTLLGGGSCKDITRKDCYDSVINDRCCATCTTLKSTIPACQYGDKDKSCETIRPRDCYNSQVATMCCETCQRYHRDEPGCEYGDVSEMCMENLRTPRDCYDRNSECCSSCVRYRVPITGCEFGDKTSWCSSITRDRCYLDAQYCCKTCRDLIQPQFEGCEYGDYELSCGSISPADCYTREKTCCETCRRLLTGPPGCEWGDLLDNCVENDCKHPDTRRKCCKFCGDFNSKPTLSLNKFTTQLLSSTEGPTSLAYTRLPVLEIIIDCKKDQAVWCKDMKDRDCYVSQDTCCTTCNKRRKPVRECPYGDHYEWCDKLDISECGLEANSEVCCETCNGGRKEPTTKETTTLPTTTPLVPSCLNDQAHWCSTIKSSDCYVSESTCCVTCRQYLRNIKGCHYGDKASWCEEYVKSREHCATEEMKNQCCYSCQRILEPITEKVTMSMLATASQALLDATRTMWSHLTTEVPETPGAQGTSARPPHVETTEATVKPTKPPTTRLTTTPDIRPCNGDDKAGWCRDQHSSTCYRNYDLCCEVCRSHYTGRTDCEYGDRVSWCPSYVFSGKDCYRHNEDGRQCCQTCARFLTNNPECPYGDREANCDVRRCETEEGRKACCFTCENPYRETTLPVTTPAPRLAPVTRCDGDTATWCADLHPSFCYDEHTRSDICCSTCQKNWREVQGCEYGDKFMWCERMTSDRCRDLSTDCCNMCRKAAATP